MRKILQLSLFLLLITQTANTQVLFGTKIGYTRFGSPGMNGGTLDAFAEVPLGYSHSFSLRAGFFYRFPMNYTDHGIKPQSLMMVVPPDYVYNPYDPGLSVRSKFNDAGIFAEFLYYFNETPFESAIYVMGRTSISYSTIKRWADEPYTNELVAANPRLKNRHKITYSFGAGFGYQHLFGEKFLLFSDMLLGMPFIAADDSMPTSTVSYFPSFYFSLNAGFRYVISSN